MTKILMCWRCKYYLRGKNNPRRTCSAFPEKIPKKVLFEETPHHRQMENQIGDFVFEPITKEEKNYIKYFEGLNKLIRERPQIEEEAFSIAKGIIDNLNHNENKNFSMGEVRIHRGESRMVINIDKILFFNANGKAELVSLGMKSELFGKLRTVLFIESIENHNTDLEFKIFKNGDCQLNFTNLTMKERREKKEAEILIYDQIKIDVLIGKGYNVIPSILLEKEIIHILENEDKNNLPPDSQLEKILQGKNYAVLETEIAKTRRKLGYKNKRELRIERLKEKYKNKKGDY